MLREQGPITKWWPGGAYGEFRIGFSRLASSPPTPDDLRALVLCLCDRQELIFGSSRKPGLVLTDALSSDLGLVNKEETVPYDTGIPEEGLSWCALVTDLLPQHAAADL